MSERSGGNRGSEYRTRQRELIIERLIAARDRHITADELVEELRGDGVGRSTVYRALERLVDKGEVRKYRLDDGGSCYQYTGGDDACREHHHLMCLRCGRLFHTECGFLDELSAHIMKDHKFRLDTSRTVLYGVCEKCAEAEAEEEQK